MENTLRTPGKWKTIFDEDGCRVYSDMFGGICNIPHLGKHRQEHEANARLIAAAPELLEALQNAMHILLIADMKTVDTETPYKKAKIVIAKAIGEKEEAK